MQLNDEGDIELLNEAFQCIGKTTGLCINPLKTAILAVGRVPANIDIIGKVVTSAKHLGVYLSLDHKTAYRQTYNAAISKMNKKSTQIFFSNRDNILKRRLIVTTMLVSCVYHIMSVFLPFPKEMEQIDKIVRKSGF